MNRLGLDLTKLFVLFLLNLVFVAVAKSENTEPADDVTVNRSESVTNTKPCKKDPDYLLPEGWDTSFTQPLNVTCTSGYQAVFEQCYKLLDRYYHPGNAQDACKESGGVVAEVKDDLTNGAIYKLTRINNRINETVIGVMCGESCNNLTSFGNASQNFTAWERCEPNHDHKYVVTNYRHRKSKAMWNNVRGMESREFQVACQIKHTCPGASYHVNGKTITFAQTEGGEMANSLETCSDGVPVAQRLCQEYSALTAFWAPLEEVEIRCPRTTTQTTRYDAKDTTEGPNETTKDDLTTPEQTTLPERVTRGTTTTRQATRHGPQNTKERPTETREDNPTTHEQTTLDEQVTQEKATSRQFTTQNTQGVSDELAKIAEDDPLSPEVKTLLKEITQETNTSPQITENVVSAIDDVISELDGHVTTDVTSSNTTNQQFINYLEQQITNLQRSGNGEFNFSTENIRVQTYRLENNDLDDVPFRGSSSDDDDITISFPPNLLESSEVQDPDFETTVALSVIEYKNPVLFASEVTTTGMKKLATNVFGVTLEGRIIEDLSSPIALSLPLEIPANSSTEVPTFPKRRKIYTCSFWDFKKAEWSSEGCQTAYVTSNSVECHCNHLTNFGVLLHESPSVFLDYVTKIGCMLSITGLTVTIIFFLFIRKSETKLPQKILMNLSIALVGFYLAFLFGIERRDMNNKTLESIVCAGSAAVIHYLILVVTAWMCVEALHMFLLFVKVSKAIGNRFLYRAVVFAWGIPVLPVTISLLIWKDNYIAESYCFLNTDFPLMLGFLPVVFIMFVFNTVCYIGIIKRLTFAKKMGSAKNSRRTKVLRVMNSVAIWTLLGMSWGFGFLSLTKNFFGTYGTMGPFDVLFCIALSSKGIIIFFLFCVGNMEFRDYVRRGYIRVRCYGRKKYHVRDLAERGFSMDKTTCSMGHTTEMQPNPTCTTVADTL